LAKVNLGRPPLSEIYELKFSMGDCVLGSAWRYLGILTIRNSLAPQTFTRVKTLVCTRFRFRIHIVIVIWLPGA